MCVYVSLALQVNLIRRQTYFAWLSGVIWYLNERYVYIENKLIWHKR